MKPLAGLTVLITRPRPQAAALAEPLEKLGARTMFQPLIDIQPVPENSPEAVQLDKTIVELASLETGISTLVLVSRNGVLYFLERCRFRNLPPQALQQLQLIAIGRGTAEEIRLQWAEERLPVPEIIVPESSNSQSLARLICDIRPPGKVLIVRGNRGSSVLPEKLTEEGIEFEQCVAYLSRDVVKVDEEVLESLKQQVDWITITSSSLARGTGRLLGQWLEGVRLVSISPTTSAALREVGLEPAAEAKSYDLDGVIRAIVANSVPSEPHDENGSR